MEKGYHRGQELTMSELGLSLEELAGQPLELFAREGAKLLLTVALEEEVTECLMRRPYERSQGKVRGYRNGHRERQVSCGAGIIEVPVPRVSDTEETFAPSYSRLGSAVASSWKKRSPCSTLRDCRRETSNGRSSRCGGRADSLVPVFPGRIKLSRRPSTTGATATYPSKR